MITLTGLALLASLAWALWDPGVPKAWLRDARPIPYFAAMCLFTSIGVPFTPFFLLAGAAFGVGPALIGSALALAGSLAVTYRIARGGLRPRLVAHLRRSGRELPDYGGAGRKSLRFALAVKFAPGVPAIFKNCILVIGGVPFPLYFGLSFLVTGAYGAALIVVGESLLAHDLGRVWPAAGVVAATAVALWWWLRRRRRRSRSFSDGGAG